MKKYRILYWAVVAAAMAAILLGSWRERVDLFWEGTDLTSPDAVHRYWPSITVNDTLVDPGMFARSSPIALKRSGDYRTIIRYDCDTPGNTVEVMQYDGVNPDNTKAVMFAQAQLEPGPVETVLNLHIDEPTDGLFIQASFVAGATVSLHSLALIEDRLFYPAHLLLALAVGLFAAVCYHILLAKPLALGEVMTDRIKKLAPLFIVLAAGLYVSYPLYAFGGGAIPYGHDIQFHVARIRGVADSWRDGQFPARIYPSMAHNKGYAAGAMYPDLFLWPGAVLYLLGVPPVWAYCFTLTAANLATAAIAFYVGKRLFGTNFAAGVVCLAYTFAAYRLTNVVFRSAVGESLAMTFAPLLVLGLYEIFFGDAKKWPILVIACTGIIQSHVLSVFLYGLFAGLFVLVFIARLFRQPARLFALLKGAGVAVLANLWFLVPFLYMNTQDLIIHHESTGRVLEGVPLGELFMGHASDETNTIIHAPGVLLVLLFAAALAALLFVPAAKGWRYKNLCLVGAGFAALALWMCSAEFPWPYVQRIPLLGNAFLASQFVWRLLIIPSVLIPICAGAVATLLPAGIKPAPPLLALLALCVVITNTYYDDYLLRNIVHSPTLVDHDSLGGDGLYLYALPDAWAAVDRDGTVQSSKEGLTVTNLHKSGNHVQFDYQMAENATLEVPLFWYPGYRAQDGDGDELALIQYKNGMIRLKPASTSGSIKIWYQGPWFYRVGDGISLATLLGCGVYGVLRWRKRRGGTGKAITEGAA